MLANMIKIRKVKEIALSFAPRSENLISHQVFMYWLKLKPERPIQLQLSKLQEEQSWVSWFSGNFMLSSRAEVWTCMPYCIEAGHFYHLPLFTNAFKSSAMIPIFLVSLL